MCRQVAQSSRENVDHLQFSRNQFGTRHICEINETELRTNCDINDTLRDYIASKLNKRRSGERRETMPRMSHDYRASVLNYMQLCRQRFVKSASPI